MKKELLALVAVCATAPALAAETTIKPFHAEYATLRNGSEMGHTTLDLIDNHDGTWTLRSQTKGTSGAAKLVGIDITETSRLRWKDGRPEAIVYDYKQNGGFKQRTRHADFDWKAGVVHIVEGDGSFQYATAPGLIDRQTVTLAIANDLLRGATSFDYKIAVKDRIEEAHYTRNTTISLSVPAGTFDAVPMQNTGATGSDRKRVAHSWFAPSLGWLPVQIEQVQKSDTITLKLMSSKR
ncbi:MAG: DUF3108 domain-containing protein [Rhodanobacter sp.]|jgi:hypothetical protein|nr:DUF3108 domain-containing protein [Rhodanobacter sp.]